MKNDFHTVRGYENINSTRKLLTPAMEDYLEMIYRFRMENKIIRLNKIAQMLNVRNSSASKMMKKLGELALINYEKYGVIELTENGITLGKYLLERHMIIEKFLGNIGGKDEILIETELIEHVISSETVENINMLNMFLENEISILKQFNKFKKSYK